MDVCCVFSVASCCTRGCRNNKAKRNKLPETHSDPNVTVLSFLLLKTECNRYFWFLRKRGIRKNSNLKGYIVAEDRSWMEDPLFAMMQVDAGLMTKLHYSIYSDLYEEYKLELPIPNIWIYIDITPEDAYSNLWKRIYARRGYKYSHVFDRYWKNLRAFFGVPNDPEELITKDYMKKLMKIYYAWRNEMKRKYGERFIIVPNNSKFEDLVDIIEKKLGEFLVTQIKK